MDMDVLKPIEKLDKFQVDIFLHQHFFLSFSLTTVRPFIHTVTYLQTLLIDACCPRNVWDHSQCPSSSYLLCLLWSGIVSWSLLHFLDCDLLKSSVGCFAVSLLWSLFGVSPGSVCWWEKHRGNVLFIFWQSRRHSADLHHPGINHSRPLCKVCLLISSL